MLSKFRIWISRRRSIIAATVVVGLMLAGATTRAHAAIVTFSWANPLANTVRVTYGGAQGVDPLVGVDLIVDMVAAAGASLAGPPQTIANGELDFETGPNATEPPPNWTFSVTGSFVTVEGITDATGPSAVNLFSGWFVAPPSPEATAVLGFPTTMTITGSGSGSLHPALAAHFGVASQGSFELTVAGIAQIGFANSFDMAPQAVSLQVTVGTVPEPGTMACWSVLLIGMAFVAARRRRRS